MPEMMEEVSEVRTSAGTDRDKPAAKQTLLCTNTLVLYNPVDCVLPMYSRHFKFKGLGYHR